jgi:lipid-A-disaccharide synthase
MRIGFVAGEASGDLLGAGLIRSLQARVPGLQCEGVAGPLMRAAGCQVIADSEVLAVMGLIEPIREIPRLIRLRRMLLSRWREDPPDVVVGIDSPDFNLGLEIKLRRSGIPTVHYVSPSVWAWRQGRIKKIRKAADKVLCLLPFEKKFFDDHNVAADFVGHPMAERISENPDRQAARQALGLSGGPLVAVLPGSRKSEVARLGPVFAAACTLLTNDSATRELNFVAPMASPALKSLFGRHLAEASIGHRFMLLDGDAETAMVAADVVMLASGTATLEAALLQRPMVAAYKVSPLTYLLARKSGLIKTPFFALPNLLTENPLVPELEQSEATADAVKVAVSRLLLDEAHRQSVIEGFSQLRGQLAKGADERAADAVLQVTGHAGSGSCE